MAHKPLLLALVLMSMTPIISTNNVAIAAQSSNLTLGSKLRARANETLLSAGGVFALGFYSGIWPNVYTLAIWYAQDAANSSLKTVVWMADRSTNLSSNAVFTLSRNGELQVWDKSFMVRPLWTSNTTNMNVTKAVMLDTGNLVLLNSTDQTVWQSFNSPTDTLLPGQQYVASANVTLFAWSGHGDWTPSRYSLGWINAQFLNTSWNSPYDWTSNATESYWGYVTPISSLSFTLDGELYTTDFHNTSNTLFGNSSVNPMLPNSLRRLTFDVDGNLRMYTRININGGKNYIGNQSQYIWNVTWEAISDMCTVYGYCGPFGLCVQGNCVCLEGFEYVDTADVHQGCKRKMAIGNCINTDSINNGTIVAETMTRFESVDFPFVGRYRYYDNVTLDFCLHTCLSACFCQSFTVHMNHESEGYYRCSHKKDALFNGHIKIGKTAYIRMVQNLSPLQDGISFKQKLEVETTTLGLTVVFLAVLSYFIAKNVILRPCLREFRMRKIKAKWSTASLSNNAVRFTYEEVRFLTKEFAEEVGRGDHGSVFKGEIALGSTRGVVVAVKRFDKLSVRDKLLFENTVIGKGGGTRHPNVVNLGGYCVAGEDKRLLVHEYLHNSSLDKLLFRPLPNGGKTVLLEWRLRYRIAIETARGLAHLHEGLTNPAHHGGVKPENILLESHTFSAKLGDGEVSWVTTRAQISAVRLCIHGNKVVSLAPPGVHFPNFLNGVQSKMPGTMETDIYSFGIVLLELISGQRSKDVPATPAWDDLTSLDPNWFLPLWAFLKLKSDSFLEVADPLLCGILDPGQVKQALQIAFWCLGDAPVRPFMAMVVQMLEGHLPVPLPVPQPAFYSPGHLPCI